MAKIVSSTHSEELPQSDGRRWVHEVHVWDDGTLTDLDTLFSPEADLEAVIKQRATDLNAAEADKPVPDPIGIAIEDARLAYQSADWPKAKQALNEAISLGEAKK